VSKGQQELAALTMRPPVGQNAAMFKRLVVFIGTTSAAVAVVLAFTALIAKRGDGSSSQQTVTSVAWVGCIAFAVIALCAAFEVLTGNHDDE